MQKDNDDLQLRSREDSQSSPKKAVPYVKVSSSNFQSNKDIPEQSYFKRDTLIINDDDISMKVWEIFSPVDEQEQKSWFLKNIL